MLAVDHVLISRRTYLILSISSHLASLEDNCEG